MIELWPDWFITTDHPASKDGIPVLVSPSGRTYGPEDIEPPLYSQAELAKALGVSTAAIRDRIRRGTLPEYDGHTSSGRGYWFIDTIKHLIGSVMK
ncbi:hypothetical protein B2I21_08860 [Chryseobacterium mucoviscidosis]|nr:hypothetical protein B2I21_08860 [Chryseobacterium mucoviscidosis]